MNQVEQRKETPGEYVARIEMQAWVLAQNPGPALLLRKCVHLAAHLLEIAAAEFENNTASMPVGRWFEGWTDEEKRQFVAFVNCTQPKLGDDLPVEPGSIDNLPDYWVMETLAQLLKGVTYNR